MESIPVTLILLAALGAPEARVELEQFEALVEPVVRELERRPPPKNVPRRSRAGLRLRDNLPSALTTQAVGRNEPSPATPATEGLPPGILDPGRYDMRFRFSREVASYVRLFSGRGRRLFARWLARKSRYEAPIRAALKRHGLPRDLEWLVLVESGYSPTAVSRAGAVGLWQFMHGTAADYGMRIDRDVDERRDPYVASEAGCRLLADLHRRFGTWELAMAAYNAGVGYVAEAVRRYNTNDFWSLARYDYLPNGSRHYVARVLAAAIVGKHPELFGFGGVVRDPPVESVSVTVKGGTRLAALARAAGVDVKTLERLNPALRRSRTPQTPKTWEVRLPPDAIPRFTAGWERIRTARKGHKRITLRFGETLRDVAYAYKVSIHGVRQINGLARHMGLEDLAGQEIVVPVAAARSPRLRPAPDPPTAVVLPAIRFEYPDRSQVLFRVPKRVGLPAVADHFAVSVNDLAMWNGLNPDGRLQPGMVLQVYPPAARAEDLSDTLLVDPTHVRIVVADSEEHAAALEAAAKARAQAAGVRRKKRTGYHRHTVKAGDTLARIAKRYRTSVQALARLNRIPPPHRLSIGQVLRVRRGGR